MKTAEVAIEHVLTGLLAMCAFILPFLANSNICLSSSERLVGTLGIAYLLGVVFDRLADTILSSGEDWLRLKKAAENLDRQAPCVKGDPFPQAALEFSLRGRQDGRLEWMDSLRGRIRTARGLAAYGLPATLGIAIYTSLAGQGGTIGAASPLSYLHAFVAVNLALGVISVWLTHRRPPELMRTDKLPTSESRREATMSRARRHKHMRILPYFLIQIFSATAIGLAAVGGTDSTGFIVLGIGGAVCTLFALWAWQRIVQTYFSFVCLELPSLVADHTG